MEMMGYHDRLYCLRRFRLQDHGRRLGSERCYRGH